MRSHYSAFVRCLFVSCVLLACGEIKSGNGPADAPAAPPASLTVVKNGNGSGTVTSTPAGINCGNDCTTSFAPGTVVTLAAAPDADQLFTGWSGGGCTGTDKCGVTMTTDTSVQVAFAKQQFTVTVALTGNGPGHVTSTPAGINCGSTCSATFDVGTHVTLQLTPDVNSTFVGWTGVGCTGTGPCNMTVSTDTTLQAPFALNNSLVVTRAGNGAGSVTSSDNYISCGSNCSHQYSPNSMVTLIATPDAQSNFTGWSGGGCSGSTFCVVTVSAATTVTATFTLKSVLLTSGVPVTGLSGATGTQQNFQIAVGAGQTVIVQISGGTGDADMYTLAGAAPTLSTYNCAPLISGNNEICTATPSAATTMFIMLNGRAAYSGVTLVATVVTVTVLGNNVPVLNLSGAGGSQRFFKLTVPAGQTSVGFQITGSVPDADLYVRRGSTPTTTSYDCRPYTGTSNETCSFTNPAAGDWYVMVRGFSAYSAVTLVGHFP